MIIPFAYYVPSSKSTTRFKIDFRKALRSQLSLDTKTSHPYDVHLASFLAASIRAGYGSLIAIRKNLKGISASQASDLRAYIDSRVSLLKTALTFAPGVPLRYRDYVKFVESSERAVLSFLLGLTSAQLATHVWLRKHYGTSLKELYHYRLYCHPATGSLAVTPSLKSKKDKKVPDFLALDSADNWHVVEAKGLSPSTGSIWRTAALGMKQARQVVSVSTPGGAGKLVSHNVVVASANSKGEICVTLIDPPAEGESPGLSIAVDRQALHLADSVALISIFEALQESKDHIDVPGFEFAIKGIPHLDLTLGVPSTLLNAREQIVADFEFAAWSRKQIARAIGQASRSNVSETSSAFRSLLARANKVFPEKVSGLLEVRDAIERSFRESDVNIAMSAIHQTILWHSHGLVSSTRAAIDMARDLASPNQESFDWHVDLQGRQASISGDGLLVIPGRSWTDDITDSQ